jgi:hypothetical protein
MSVGTSYVLPCTESNIHLRSVNATAVGIIDIRFTITNNSFVKTLIGTVVYSTRLTAMFVP